MDKKAFLHQLESSAANKDKKLFAETIYDLPDDVIVGFTKEEFSRIIYISHQFNAQKMERLFNFIETKGLASLKNALKGINDLNNSLLSKFYFSICISICETNREKIKNALINNAIACYTLANFGIDRKDNLEDSVRLCNVSKTIFHKTSKSYGIILINEGNARRKLAEIGIDSEYNLNNAVRLFAESRKTLPKNSEDYAVSLINEGATRLILAERGIDYKDNIEHTIRLCAESRTILPKNGETYSFALITEGSARKELAGMGIDSKYNLEYAIMLYTESHEILPNTSTFYAIAQMNEGNARKRLAEMWINSRENLEHAITLYTESRKVFHKTTMNYALTLINESNVRQILSEMGIDSKKNLETAVSLYTAALEKLPEKSILYACALTNGGDVRLELAEMGIDTENNLEIAINLYSNAQEILPKKSESYAGSLINEGNARSKLAEINVNSRENLKIAINLYADAQEIFPNTSADYANALMNEGNARSRLAKLNIESKDNFEKSKELYLKSISILEELKNGWMYSAALLNFNSLLKENFDKTGDKEYLEEWGRNLGDIEEKIKNRDIKNKELLMARIHEIRASLFEFNGKLGIYKASCEYDKAYRISKNPYYKFMDEFCQARIDIKSFCELVFDWKEVEKKDIFLDYYDYTVFECHLENALESTINEEEKLKLAEEKLKEIRDRTQIKIVKDKVSAYIYLLQALIDCFTKDSYKEAAENVKKGCNIFREYEDRLGQQTCETFHNAIVKKRDPDAWQEIIRNREFSSNFYSLLCEYSNRKRADLELYRSSQLCRKMDTISEELDQVKEISIRTENKIDEIQFQMHLGFAEIKGQIEEGFDGTAAELRQIKEKINNIEQDLDNLVQISNDVGGKEGECIREFASQMLELMKKGDYEALKCFSEKIVQNSSSIEEIIEAAEIPEKEKAEAKSKLVDLKKIPEILKGKGKSLSAGVTENVIANLISGEIVDGEAIKIVSLASAEIIKLLIPVLSTAAFGVPIPSKVVEILFEAIRDS